MSLHTNFHAPRTTLSGRIQIGHKGGFYLFIIIIIYYLVCLGLAITIVLLAWISNWFWLWLKITIHRLNTDFEYWLFIVLVKFSLIPIPIVESTPTLPCPNLMLFMPFSATTWDAWNVWDVLNWCMKIFEADIRWRSMIVIHFKD